LLSALFRCRTRLFRQSRFSPQPPENHHTLLITPAVRRALRFASRR
jgi:hypothetical protein